MATKTRKEDLNKIWEDLPPEARLALLDWASEREDRKDIVEALARIETTLARPSPSAGILTAIAERIRGATAVEIAMLVVAVSGGGAASTAAILELLAVATGTGGTGCP